MTLKLKNISFEYQNKKILTSFTKDFVGGKTYGLWGDSGSGKSTLCRLMAGELTPQQGEITLENKNILGKMFKKVMLVSQDNDLLSWQTVQETVNFFKNKEVSSRELLKFVSLSGSEMLYPKQLSGGMKKRLSLCRALSVDPEVLIVDELFSSQDGELQEEIFLKLSRLVKEKNKILLLVSHDVSFLKTHCDDVFSLS